MSVGLILTALDAYLTAPAAPQTGQGVWLDEFPAWRDVDASQELTWLTYSLVPGSGDKDMATGLRWLDVSVDVLAHGVAEVGAERLLALAHDLELYLDDWLPPLPGAWNSVFPATQTESISQEDWGGDRLSGLAVGHRWRFQAGMEPV